MNLDVELWASFQVKDILSIHNGKGITTEEIEENAGDFAVVQSGEENNGVLGKIDLNYCKLKGYIYTEKPCLTVARSGSAGFVSFQKDGCVVGDSAKILLLPDEVAKTEIYLFLHSILTANRFKYDYGRKVTENKYMSDYIDLPAITKGHKKKPDFEFMENYIKSLHYKPLTTKNRPENALALDTNKWGEFSLNSLFEVVLSKGDIKIDEVESGLIPLVSSGETNNGVVGYIDSRGDGKAEIFKGNTITIDMFCNAFYQKDDFYAVSHGRVNILKPKFILNQYIAIFIITLIHQNKYRYSYGRALYSDEAKKMTIKLPINHKGELDFDFMENYIKSLPYGDRV
ncbi:TPA: restriction endonuclease subunit S [Campylobacter upsaliensis]|nr:restriction endonuclease subunit S [Campylobacter upsaliensis]